jgi:hypothetical protein
VAQCGKPESPLWVALGFIDADGGVIDVEAGKQLPGARSCYFDIFSTADETARAAGPDRRQGESKTATNDLHLIG